MSMFDSVLAECPICGTKNKFQSKSGPCQLKVFELDDAPADVLGDVNRHSVVCKKCMIRYKVVTKCFSKTVVINTDDEKDDDGQDND